MAELKSTTISGPLSGTSATFTSNDSVFGNTSLSGVGLRSKSASGGITLALNGRNNAGIDDNFLIFYKFDGTTTQGRIYARSNIISIQDATATDVLSVTAGQVGIGTSTPGAKFQVNDGTNINLAIKVGQTDVTAVMLNAYNDAASANIPLEFRASKFNFTSGNVGIGIASPLNLFDVKGAIFTGSYATSAGARFHDNVYGINFGGIDASSVGVIQGSAFEVGAANIALQPNGGNVGIGTNSPSGLSSSKTLDIYGGASIGGELVLEGNSGGNFLSMNAGTSSGDLPIILFNRGLRIGHATAKDATGYASAITIASTGAATFSSDVVGKRFYQFETSGTVAGTAGTATIAAYNNANFVANTWYEVKVTKSRNNTTGFGVTASLYCYWTGNLTAGTEVLKAIGGDAIITMSSNNITITNSDATTNNWGATFTKINTN